MVYLFNGTSTFYEIFNAEIWFIYKYLIMMIIFYLLLCIFWKENFFYLLNY